MPLEPPDLRVALEDALTTFAALSICPNALVAKAAQRVLLGLLEAGEGFVERKVEVLHA